MGIMIASEGLAGPEWLAGITTLLVVILAATTFWVAQRTAIRQHAERVVVWASRWSYDEESDLYTPYEATIYNGSNLPIFSASIRVPGTPGRTLDSISPNKEVTVDMPSVRGIRWSRHGGSIPMPPPLQIEFYDGFWRRWRRDPNGLLTSRSVADEPSSTFT